MKIKLYYILHGDIHGIYTVTVSLSKEEVNVDSMADIVTKAKRKFNIPGKLFTVLAGDSVYHVCKHLKVWKAYELKGAEEEDEEN